MTPLPLFEGDTLKLGTIFLRVLAIPGILARTLTRKIDPEFRVKPGICFGPDDFSQPVLNPEEMARLNGFKVMKKQVEWLCGRFAAKDLARQTLMPDHCLDKIDIAYKEEGAPFLAGFPGHSLSLSHSGDLTAVAISTCPEETLGLDIEAVGSLPGPSFMKTAFTPKEMAAMEMTPEAVFQCWTVKEAYLKLIEKGFNESLHMVEVTGNRIWHQGREQKVAVRSWRVRGEYILSLVTGQT